MISIFSLVSTPGNRTYSKDPQVEKCVWIQLVRNFTKLHIFQYHSCFVLHTVQPSALFRCKSTCRCLYSSFSKNNCIDYQKLQGFFFSVFSVTAPNIWIMFTWSMITNQHVNSRSQHSSSIRCRSTIFMSPEFPTPRSLHRF